MTGPIINSPCPIRRLGSDAGHHFFGYYNKTVWDRTGRYVLANRVPMADAPLTPELEAEVGFFDLAEQDRFHRAGTTRAWNWQMGCQLQWLDGLAGRQLVYNCRADNPDAVYPGYASVVHDADSGAQRMLPLPVYSVAPDSSFALCVNYSRLYITHETIGYAWTQAPEAMPNAPADDGIHCMDIATGQSRLAISYADLRDFHPVASMDKAIHWVSHIEISPDSSRFLFLHRWTERVKDETCFLHRLITANPDGSDMRLLEDSDHPLPQLADDFDPSAVGTYDYEKSEYQISHPLWCADGRIIVWGPHAGSIHYHRYTDAPGAPVEVIGRGILTENGHMSFSPVDARWLLSDTYPDPDTHERILFLYDTRDNVRHDIGSFYADPNLKKENRCDLHPRWSRDGQSVCIDSVHEHERQMYVLDVSGIVGA
ncbi:hypothetical protein SAMN05428957_102243 [Oryzisolibacter propanilivorax]|uniref:WD40-like Beta Propeller Repeat n=1 Tax=Oryzisolibacter propanilivorax TaxID=1527607 RepID=A0A1G9QF16_9BURK|nr:hypothetical protein [Oryzisolibacter propanilivorax]SDM09077.1 hypothetical protein SAMN05428957_102243 [Oryzisolibacter propanilivorax]